MQTNSRFSTSRSTAALFTRLVLAASGTAIIFGGIAGAATPARTPLTGEVVTRAQAERAAATYFTRLDVNNDGKLDEADRAAVREKMRNMHFDALDANHDGTVSREEFRAAESAPGMVPARAFEPALHRGDRRAGVGPGMADPRGAMTAEFAMQRLMRTADTNHDGSISKAEFTASADQRFALMDTDHDGKVTPEERRAARKAMLANRPAKWEADKSPAN